PFIPDDHPVRSRLDAAQARRGGRNAPSLLARQVLTGDRLAGNREHGRMFSRMMRRPGPCCGRGEQHTDRARKNHESHDSEENADWPFMHRCSKPARYSDPLLLMQEVGHIRHGISCPWLGLLFVWASASRAGTAGRDWAAAAWNVWHKLSDGRERERTTEATRGSYWINTDQRELDTGFLYFVLMTQCTRLRA